MQLARHLIGVRLGEAPDVAADERDGLRRAVFDRLFGLGDLQRHVDNPTFTDVLVNGTDRVWAYTDTGEKVSLPALAETDDELVEILQGLARHNGLGEREFNQTHPALNLHLPDGSRLFAAGWLCGRISVSVRRHRFFESTLHDLVGLGMLDTSLARFLSAAVRARLQIIVSGGMGVGKTTLLRALAAEIPTEERIVTIESELELGLDQFGDTHPDCQAFEAREANLEGHGGISQAQLVAWTQRMRPDRVIVGEIRGAEVHGLLSAMSNGMDGSMGTIHAQSSLGAFQKLCQYAISTPERLPFEVTASLIATAVNLSVHVAKTPEGRVVSSVRWVSGHDGQRVVSDEVYAPGPDRRAAPTGVIPRGLAERLEDIGYTEHLTGGPARG